VTSIRSYVDIWRFRRRNRGDVQPTRCWHGYVSYVTDFLNDLDVEATSLSRIWLADRSTEITCRCYF